MKSINSHFSIMISVFILLFSFQFTRVVNTIVNDYAVKIIDDYAIVLVSSSELTEETLKKEIPEIHSLSEISSKKILDRLKNDMSSKNLTLLQVALPKFYSLKLETLPNQKRLESIKQKLASITSITRIETFAKTHEKVFKMFLLLQSMVYVFAFFIGFVAILLIFKQIRIWTYEHNRRMSIMTLFGASFFMKSAMLYRMTLVDSFLSAIAVCLVYMIAPKLAIVQNFANELDIRLPEFNFLVEGGTLIGVSLLFSFLAVTMVARRIGRV
ncbi:FtsX-like permease family protein [Sulfurospirillum deleyianum]|uniref:Cell division protein FtsX n=1 Tax=Sulfurospirillum deleyianum (strain ATCC 51133 / DSM 6946 / 5175) TaxID=525898 RepID=D1B062_SULD5|nr:FtsX-like permease family protein [Sulfurospirillum deleyianum]ACZ11679.1 cell division protein FtsX [Sulfurospirillum deleyianum DSM 6946]